MEKQRIINMPLRAAHYKILAVSSAEQIIGAALSTLVGIIIPMIQLVGQPHLSTLMQGILAASGLTGISLGSAIIGKLSDDRGYASFFRLCPAIITIGSLVAWIWPNVTVLIVAMFVVGVGVGGGYSLDGDYISQLMPKKWKLFMVGVAKASSAIGFMGAALFAWIWFDCGLQADQWNRLMLIMAAMGAVTFIFRIRWPHSPRWLLDRGRNAEAQKATQYFFGPQSIVAPLPQNKITTKKSSWGDMFHGKNLIRVIYSGIPWAFEGVGVYGVGVFIPLLVMDLGIVHSDAVGLPKIVNSVELTTYINCFILLGFIVGLLLVRRLNHKKMLWQGFAGAALFLTVLLLAYLLKWPVVISVLAFGLFEVFLNAGPHLITFIIPSEIYPVAVRGAGSGIAAMLGKVGAIVGVFCMPLLLNHGGIVTVLAVCIAIMATGALISLIFGKIVAKMQKENSDNDNE